MVKRLFKTFSDPCNEILGEFMLTSINSEDINTIRAYIIGRNKVSKFSVSFASKRYSSF